MASTYSTNLAIELIGTGEQSGTWGTTTNTNLGTLIEQSISGYVTQAITDGSGANTTITIPNGATGVARNMFIEMTGALSFSTTSLIVPANKKMYFIFNNTSGGFAVTVKVSGQTGILVPNGKKVVLTSNGTDIVEAHTAIVGNATMGGTLGITGTTTAAAINASGLVAMAGAATIGTTLAVTGTTTAAAINASGTVAMAGAATIGTTLAVTGTTTAAAINASGTVAMAGAATVGTTLAVTGTSTMAAINASGLVAMAGAATVGTTLGVTGATTLSSTLAVTGAAALSSTLAVTGVTTLAGGGGYSGTQSLAIGNSTNDYTFTSNNSNASSPNGMFMNYSNAAPNGTANMFLDCRDNVGVRFQARSNGGIVNYSANNVNLSDKTVKSNFVPMPSFRDEFAAMQGKWIRFKYIDQSHADYNSGYLAQDIKKVFGAKAPELVDWWQTENRVEVEDAETGEKSNKIVPIPESERKLAVYNDDLHNIGLAVISELVIEQNALRAEFAAYKAARP